MLVVKVLRRRVRWLSFITFLSNFNFILHIILAFVTAYLHVLCPWLSIISIAREATRYIPFCIVRLLYWLLAMVNSPLKSSQDAVPSGSGVWERAGSSSLLRTSPRGSS